MGTGSLRRFRNCQANCRQCAKAGPARNVSIVEVLSAPFSFVFPIYIHAFAVSPSHPLAMEGLRSFGFSARGNLRGHAVAEPFSPMGRPKDPVQTHHAAEGKNF